MALPLQITIRDIPQTDALTTHIEQKAEKLSQFYDRIISCKLVVEQPQKNQHQGKIYNVRIDLIVPGEELVVNKVWDEDVYVSIRDAFNAVTRQLQDYVRRHRGKVKNHQAELTTHGRVARVFPDDGFGFIQSFDGREFYFNRDNVVHPEFDQLDIGTAVQFLESIGDDGLQANRVSAGKHQPLESG